MAGEKTVSAGVRIIFHIKLRRSSTIIIEGSSIYKGRKNERQRGNDVNPKPILSHVDAYGKGVP
jgi:hypothetical protein